MKFIKVEVLKTEYYIFGVAVSHSSKSSCNLLVEVFFMKREISIFIGGMKHGNN